MTVSSCCLSSLWLWEGQDPNPCCVTLLIVCPQSMKELFQFMDTSHYRLLIRPSSTCDHHSTFVPITGNLLRSSSGCKKRIWSVRRVYSKEKGFKLCRSFSSPSNGVLSFSELPRNSEDRNKGRRRLLSVNNKEWIGTTPTLGTILWRQSTKG